MRLVVKENIKFELNKNGYVDVIVNNKKITEIEQELHLILCLFNGYLESDEIKKIFESIFNVRSNESEKVFNHILKKCGYVLEENNNLRRDLTPYVHGKVSIDFNRIRSIVPNTLVVSLTRDCFMKCRYCYAGANYSEVARKENTLELEYINKIVLEAKELGIKHIDLTGGDPFIRKDIFEVLSIFEQNNITTSLSTKKFLSETDIKKLKEYKNLRDIQISLDTMRDEVQEKLIGKTNYSSKMIDVLRNMVSNDLNVRVNSVVTSENIDDIIELAKILNSIGIKNYTISPYSNNLWRKDTNLFPSYEKYGKLYKDMEKLDIDMKVDYPMILSTMNKETYLQFKLDQNQATCTAGLDGFVIGPTGDASICERVAYNKEFFLGNIRELSLLEIWNSPEFKKYYNPSITQFKGTKCYDCDENEYCIKKRGICYVHSLLLNNKVFSPDYNCKFNEDKIRIF